MMARSASALLGRGVAPRPRPKGWRSALTTWHPGLQAPPLRSPFQQPVAAWSPLPLRPRPWGRLQNRVQCTEGPAPAALGFGAQHKTASRAPGLRAPGANFWWRGDGSSPSGVRQRSIFVLCALPWGARGGPVPGSVHPGTQATPAARPRHLPALLLTLEAGSCLPAALLTPPERVTKLFK